MAIPTRVNFGDRRVQASTVVLVLALIAGVIFLVTRDESKEPNNEQASKSQTSRTVANENATSSTANSSNTSSTVATSAPPTQNSNAALREQTLRALADAPKVDVGKYQAATQMQVMSENGKGGFHFRTPTDNIQCTTYDAKNLALRCFIRSYTFTPPPRSDNCSADLYEWVPNYVSIDKREVSRGLCAGDPQHENEGNAALAYDTAIKLGEYGCLSQQTGVACANFTTKRGFVLSKERTEVF